MTECVISHHPASRDFSRPVEIQKDPPPEFVVACGAQGFILKMLRYMRRSWIVGPLLVSTAVLAQQQPVEITSEPRHHLVFENQYVRVFDVTVEPRGSTLVHRHNHDYLFVTLGDSDVVSARPGEKPVRLLLKDGEARFTPGNFSHAAINQSERPFHNITIELLKASTGVKTCDESCNLPCQDMNGSACPSRAEWLIESDQWILTSITAEPGRQQRENWGRPTLVVAVANVSKLNDEPTNNAAGKLAWAAANQQMFIAGSNAGPAKYITLSFKPEKP